MTSLKFEICLEFNPGLKEKWEGFETIAECYFFQTYAWSKHWFDTVGVASGYQPLIVVVSEQESTRMLLPFAIKKQWGLWKMEWIGGIQTDYKAPMIHPSFDLDADSFHQLWNAIARLLRKQGIAFCRFDNQPQWIGKMSNPFFTGFKAFRTEYSHSAPLPENAETYLNNGPRKRISADARRQRKRLGELGSLSLARASGKDEYRLFAEVMLAQKKRRFAEMNVRNIVADAATKDFYINFIHPCIHSTALKLNDQLIAVHWGISYKKRFYYLMPSFEGGQLGKYSAGRLLLEDLVRYAVAEGCTVFDFTIGGEAYKKDWCENEMAVSLSLVPLSAAGAIACRLLQWKKNAVEKIVASNRVMAVYRAVRKKINE